MNRPGRLRRMVLWFVAALAVVFLAAPEQTIAQPTLTFTRIVNNWPTIELYFKVACDGQPAYPAAKQWYKVYENGIEVGEFTIWCPDPTQRCAISVALVFDASGSMSGSGQQGAIAAGNAFVDLMDGLVDEATIIWFTSSVNIALGMSTNITDLHNAVNSLPASGSTAVWDGIYVGLQELILSGNNPCRAVIALTDGNDNSSSHTPDEIISLANRNRIRVFTIGLGSVTPAQLETIALLTGGKYYQAPSAEQLVKIYEEISTIIFSGFLECMITYQGVCQDGGLRTVDLLLYNYCHGGQDQKTRTYRAPKDTSTYVPLTIKLGDGKGRGGSDVEIPLELVTPITPKDNFESSTFTILYDPSCVQFKEFKTPPGTLFNTVPITIDYITGGIKVTTTDRIQIEGNGILANLVFELSDPDDTTCCDIDLETWVFDAGCYKPILEDGEICIIPRAPVVNCTLAMPNELAWVRSAKDYSPNPFTVKMIVTNTGDKEATNAVFKIDYDPADLRLISPISDIQPGTPAFVDVNQTSEATWSINAERRLSGDSVEVCITAMFDNHPDVICCRKVWIPPTEPILNCTIDPISITADNDNQRYVPMPFDLNVIVSNLGGMKTDTVYATIYLSGDLVLAGADAPDNNTKKVTPNFLLPNQSGVVTWQLSHPITLAQTEYMVQVWVKTSNADSSLCEVRVVIPPLDAPSIRAACSTPTSIIFNEAADEYAPNPFEITLTAVNMGKMAAHDVTGFLYLPADVEITPTSPQQDLTYTFGTLQPWQTGSPIPSVTWEVRWTKRYRNDKVAAFKWAVAGVGATNIPTDSVFAYCETEIPGLPPSFDCTISMPTHIGLNAAETGNDPNPFTVTYTVTNTSHQTAAIDRLLCYFPAGQGISLDPSVPNNTQTRMLNQTLAPSEQIVATFVFKIDGSISTRNLNIQVVAYDDENNTISCDDNVVIDPLKTALTCDLQLSETGITYDQMLQDYNNKTWSATATLTNAGGFTLSDLTAEIKVIGDTSGYVELDPLTQTNPQTYPLLFQNGQQTFSWNYRLAKPNTTGIPIYVEFSVSYGSKETPYIENACNAILRIDPVLTPQLVCSLLAPDTLYFKTDHYEPNPFDVQLRVENVGNGDATHVMAYVLQDSRFTVATGSKSTRDFNDILAGNSVDFGDNDGFTLKVKPREFDGDDTVTVIVVADGIPSATCYYPIHVQKEKRPEFTMVCSSDANLVFDEDLNDYNPNPFEVRTIVTNTGESEARECELVFVGPRKFEPYGQNSVQPIAVSTGNVMAVGQSDTLIWNMRALLQEEFTSEKMIFQVIGKGGLNDEIVVGNCDVAINIPPARAAKYEMTCTAPSEIPYNVNTSNYNPDPFTIRVNVKNTGAATGQNIVVRLNFPTRVYLASGEEQEKMIFSLPQDADTTLTWLIRPIALPNEDIVSLCANAEDRFGTTASCCSDVKIAEATEADLVLGCSPQYSALTVNTQLGEYNENPFEIYLTVTNNSANPIHNVNATLISQSKDVKIIENNDNPREVAQILSPNVSITNLTWRVQAIPRTQSGFVTLTFRVTSDDVATRICNVEIYIPEIGQPRLDCSVMRTITTGEQDDDYYLNFDENTGDYEGTDSGEGYTYFTLNLQVQNVGDAMAKQVRARITALDGGATLNGPNTTTTVPVETNDDLSVNAIGRATWTYKATRQAEDSLRRFEVTVTSSNAEMTTCVYAMTIEGAPRIVTATIPDDLVGRFGDKIAVPIYITPTIGRDVNVYKLNVKFNPEILRYVSATNENTQTQYGWSGPRATLFKVDGSEVENLVRVQDFTTGSALSSKTDGLLVYLLFEAVYGGDDNTKLDYATSDMDFVGEFTDTDGSAYRSSMNSTVDDENGNITLELEDGLVTVSGQCIVPLNSSLKFQLAQNKPNPFNPTTVIEYTVGRDAHIKLEIFDALGRHVRTLVDEYQKQGEYRQVFDASGLPSGTYIYKLESEYFTKSMRMVLTR